MNPWWLLCSQTTSSVTLTARWHLGACCAQSLFQPSQYTPWYTHRQVTNQVPGAQGGVEIWKAEGHWGFGEQQKALEGFLESTGLSDVWEKAREEHLCMVVPSFPTEFLGWGWGGGQGQNPAPHPSTFVLEVLKLFWPKNRTPVNSLLNQHYRKHSLQISSLVYTLGKYFCCAF